MIDMPDIADHPSRVLIVDDESNNRALLEVMLASEGLLLVTASSGEEALAAVLEEPPDLILLDIMMPGMDGHKVAAQLKGNATTKSIPIIMITALDSRYDRILGLTAGAEEFLTKPVDRVELCVRVRNLLRLKAYGDYCEKHSRTLEAEVDSRTADLLERTTALAQQAAVLAEQAALLDLAHDAIVVRDMHGRILFWSRGAEVMYGWLGKQALGTNARQMLRAEFSEPVETIDATLQRHGQWAGEVIHYTRDGARLIVASRWALQRDAHGAPVRVLAIDTDITARKRADAELLLRERLSLATAVAKVGVWEWDLASNALTWDATMFDIYGCAPVVPIPYGKWSAAVHTDDRPAVEAALKRVIDEKGQGSGEYRIVRPDGSVRYVSAVERVVLDERASVSRLIGVNMDVTERREAEKALEHIRQDQLQFKDDFLSHVSHELRSPLTAIKQFTTILLGGLAGELNKEQGEYQQIVLKNIGQLQSMIDDLLEVTRLETGKLTVEPENVSVSDALTDTFDTLQGTAGAKQITLSRDVPADLPHAHADLTRLRQILIILLDNAIKFTPEGGAIGVQARLQQQDPRFLLLEVSDNGCGIPETTERLFERLYQVSEPIQTSRKGLGLGLYICKELVTRQGGQIWATRRPEGGSTFSFTLPVFSLRALIAPLLRDGKWPAESAALVMVETCVAGTRPSKESEEAWSREARSMLQRCVLPSLDVVLPAMSPGVEGEHFFVAAFADDRGAAAIADRIREQFTRLPQLKQSGRTLSVSYRMLQPFAQEVGASTESIVARMATTLEESIKSQILLEAVRD